MNKTRQPAISDPDDYAAINSPPPASSGNSTSSSHIRPCTSPSVPVPAFYLTQPSSLPSSSLSSHPLLLPRLAHSLSPQSALRTHYRFLYILPAAHPRQLAPQSGQQVPHRPVRQFQTPTQHCQRSQPLALPVPVHTLRVTPECLAAVGAAVSEHRNALDMQVLYRLLYASVFVECNSGAIWQLDGYPRNHRLTSQTGDGMFCRHFNNNAKRYAIIKRWRFAPGDSSGNPQSTGGVSRLCILVLLPRHTLRSPAYCC